MTDWTDHLNNVANQLWRLSPRCREVTDPAHLKLIAHRGAHQPGTHEKVAKDPLLENTLAAFDRCVTHGLWGIELDVRLTRDNEPVVHHDPACGRVFQRPDLVIAETTFDTLRRELPQIPHLYEVIERYGQRLHLMLELKESWRERNKQPLQLQKVLAPLEPEVDYHLLSLEPDHLEGYRFLPTSALVDVALTNTKDIIRQNIALGHGAVAGSFALLTTPLVKQLQQAGKAIGTGQINHPDIMNREAARGVDWIFSDQPLRLQCQQKSR
ncbi:glycerophosphodiester phosphodiesterase [Alkalimonas collagenimarina]|uniref:Glycerophosphodiester phosphodiesterase n=1 Tax=Alkalimonas collagenimarina TaxID=400390 RepID=A0ABT9H2T3_9GAMM|nr:glycerophosphodiester phosphodiesterase [Alkalimonas collagenimarina]MDP4537604.1 glycerophosphodiester phosphodiesterase [Alkalimonas collagenimarina]